MTRATNNNALIDGELFDKGPAGDWPEIEHQLSTAKSEFPQTVDQDIRMSMSSS